MTNVSDHCYDHGLKVQDQIHFKLVSWIEGVKFIFGTMLTCRVQIKMKVTVCQYDIGVKV